MTTVGCSTNCVSLVDLANDGENERPGDREPQGCDNSKAKYESRLTIGLLVASSGRRPRRSPTETEAHPAAPRQRLGGDHGFLPPGLPPPPPVPLLLPLVPPVPPPLPPALLEPLLPAPPLLPPALLEPLLPASPLLPPALLEPLLPAPSLLPPALLEPLFPAPPPLGLLEPPPPLPPPVLPPVPAEAVGAAPAPVVPGAAGVASVVSPPEGTRLSVRGVVAPPALPPVAGAATEVVRGENLCVDRELRRRASRPLVGDLAACRRSFMSPATRAIVTPRDDAETTADSPSRPGTIANANLSTKPGSGSASPNALTSGTGKRTAATSHATERRRGVRSARPVRGRFIATLVTTTAR